MGEKEWSIGNGQICINAGKDLIVIPDYYSSTVVDCKKEGIMEAKEWELTKDEITKAHEGELCRDCGANVAHEAQKKLMTDIKTHIHMVNDTIPFLPPEYYQRLLKAFGLEGK